MTKTVEPTDEMFEAFLMKVIELNDWDNENQPARIFCRVDAHSEWLPTPVESGDPYDILPIAVAFALDKQESMLLMYGWASKINDWDDDDVEAEPVRVRILVHMTNTAERMAIQFKGGTLEEQTDFGTGSFPEAIRDLRNLQKGRGL